MKQEQYRDPEMEIILLSENDVITTSEQGETEDDCLSDQG